MVRAVALAANDQAIGLVRAEARLSQQGVGDQVEAVAVVAVRLEELLDGRPVVAREGRLGIRREVQAGLALGPGRELPGQGPLVTVQEVRRT